MSLPQPGQILGPVLLNGALSSALLALMVVIGGRLSRVAAVRHIGWVTAFALILLLPWLLGRSSPLVRYQVGLHARGTSAAAGLHSDGPVVGASGGRWIVPTLGAVWAGGFFVCGVRFAIAAAALGRMWRRSVSFSGDGDVAGLLDRVGLARPPSIRVSSSDEPRAPVTWGFLRPVVLLPRGAGRWERQRLTAVLLHEFAHVRRRDNFTQTLALAACALHWFNPLFWHGARRMQTEAEIASDDLVLRAGARPSSYAAELLRFAAQLNGLARPAGLLGSSMATPFTLATRITSIVDPCTDRSRVRIRQVIAVSMLGVVTVCAFCLLRPSFAGDDAGEDRVRFPASQPRHARPADVAPDGERSAFESTASPDVLSETDLVTLRARRRHDASPAADLVGSAESIQFSDRPGADRLPR